MSDVEATACADAYRALRERVTSVLRAADPGGARRARACHPRVARPRRARAHGRASTPTSSPATSPASATDAWTAVQVDARRDRTVERDARRVERDQPRGRGDRAAVRHRDRTVALRRVHPRARPPQRARRPRRPRLAMPSRSSFEWAHRPARRRRSSAGTRPASCFHTEAGTKTVGAASRRTGRAHEPVRGRAGADRAPEPRARSRRTSWDGPARPERLRRLGIFTLRPDDFVE